MNKTNHSPINRQVMWKPWEHAGMEHLHLVQNNNEIVADSLIIGISESKPFRLKYTINCDLTWKVKRVTIQLLDDSKKKIGLLAGTKGQWTTDLGEPIPSLAGCIDIDISATPFTNTIAVRRLNLEIGESFDLTVAYIKAPEMIIKPVKQRYTHVKSGVQGEVYRYEALFRDFTADINFDDDSLVIDYPKTFKRIWTDRRK